MDLQNYPEHVQRVDDALYAYDRYGGDGRLKHAMLECKRGSNTAEVEGKPRLAAAWRLLEAFALELRFEESGNQIDSEHARRVFERLYPTPLLQSLRVHVAIILVERSFLQKELGDCPEALNLLEETLDALEDSDPLKALALGALGTAHGVLWELTSDEKDVAMSEECARRAVSACPTHRYRSRLLSWLATACRRQWEANESLAHLHEALRMGELVLQSISEAQEKSPLSNRPLGAVAYIYAESYDAEAKFDHLERAIELDRQIMATLTDPPPIHLINHGSHLLSHFCETGQMLQLDNAIDASLQAYARLEGGPKRLIAVTSGNLGDCYALRFLHTLEPLDAEKAVTYFQQAISQCQELGLSEYFSSYTQGLAILSFRLYEINHHAGDLDEAVEIIRGVLESPLLYMPAKKFFLSRLGEYLSVRWQLSSSVDDLTESLACHEEVRPLANPRVKANHAMLRRYGVALRHKYGLHATPETIDLSIDILSAALERAKASQHTHQLGYARDLASSFLDRYHNRKHIEDLDTALELLAMAPPAGFIMDHFQSVVAGASVAQEHDRALRAIMFYSVAIGLLPRIAWLGLNAGGRHAKLTSITSDLACNAAACAISVGELERAVEFLEEGRAVLWRSVLQLRTDFSELQTQAPELAEELLAVGRALEHDDDGGSSSSIHAEERALRRRRAAERWDLLVENARKVDGFESFLKPLSFSQLREAAERGPIVMLNVSRYRSDALIILQKEPIQLVPLHGLDYTVVRQLAYMLSQALRVAKDPQGCHFLEQVLLQVVRRLWQGGLSDVLAAIRGLHQTSHAVMTRVWWVRTGLLSLLPVHCAGPYEIGYKGISDLCISSYTTTISALLMALANHDKQDTAPTARMLAIGQSDIPGLPHLANAGHEMQIVAETCFEKSAFLFGSDATVKAVTKLLPEFSWLHCCTHGHWDARYPLNSSLHLDDGQLTLGRLIQLRPKDAALAFLSACHTARHTTVLPDESMHIAAALQIGGGFKSVVATIWAMADKDGPALAREFYGQLAVNGQVSDATKAAEALHHAIRLLREKGVPLYRWATFVHFGI